MFRKSTKEILVRGYHLDVYQHVNHARYLEFLEEARWAHLEEVKPIEWIMAKGIAMVIVNINIDYRAPAIINDLLTIETTLDELGNRKIVVHQTIKNNKTGALVADAKVTFVLVDIKTNQVIPVSDDLKELFAE